jgi:hypothetical protein
MFNHIILYNIFKYIDSKDKFKFLSISKISRFVFLKYYFLVPYIFYYRVHFNKALLINNILDIKSRKKLVHISQQIMSDKSLYNIYKTNLIHGRLSDIIFNYIDKLDIILFQILYTFDVLKKYIPKLRLNNLNIHNIGFIRKNDINGIYLYDIYKNKYEIPGIGIHIVIFNFSNVSLDGYKDEIYDIRYFIDSLRILATSSNINIDTNLKTFIKLCDNIWKFKTTLDIFCQTFNNKKIFDKYLLTI